MYDLIVIGGGPGGYMAAERAGHAGLKTLLVEKNALGGVCLNEGCIPSKTLLNSAKALYYAKHGEAYGVMTQGVAYDHNAVVERKNKVVGTLVSGVKAQMKASGVTVVNGEAEIVDKNRVKANGEAYEGKRLLIATGSEPVIPPIPGLKEGIDSGFVLTNRELLDLREIPESLVIIGGGVIGLEMASYFGAVGSKVTVIEMLHKIAGPFDAEISQMLMKSLEKKGVTFKLETKVTEINYGKAIYEGGETKADKVLLSIGRKPVTAGFGLENAGVLLERGAIVTDSHLQTNIANIYAVGDVNGKSMLAHTAYREAEVAVNHMLGRRDIMRYNAVPSVIYTSPEAAGVGETEETAASKLIEFDSVKLPMVYSGRFVAENTDMDGVCKVITEKGSKRIIGVHLLGSYSSEIIASAALMLEMEMRVEDVREIIFPHPSVSEIIREAVFKI